MFIRGFPARAQNKLEPAGFSGWLGGNADLTKVIISRTEIPIHNFKKDITITSLDTETFVPFWIQSLLDDFGLLLLTSVFENRVWVTETV